MSPEHQKGTEDILPGYSLICAQPELLEELLAAYYCIGETRNKINHAEVKDEIDYANLKEYGESPRKREVCELISFFISKYEKARELIKDMDNPSVTFDNDTFRDYRSSHKPSRQDKTNNKKEEDN